MFGFLQSLSRRLEPETTVENLSVASSPAPPLDAEELEDLDAAIEDLFEASAGVPDEELFEASAGLPDEDADGR